MSHLEMATPMVSETNIEALKREIEGRIGVWGEPRTSDAIALSDIRRWSIAVYWPETPPRQYWDQDYAKQTRWGGIVAPHEFNPFAWTLEPMPRTAPRGAEGVRGMNGGQVDSFFAIMRPGDLITQRVRVFGCEMRDTSLGPTLFIQTEFRWTNQRDELVKTRIATSIRY